MVQRIDQDLGRFKKIVRGVVKKELRKYMSTGELIGKKGKNVVSIPIRQIELPTFRHETRKQGADYGAHRFSAYRYNLPRSAEVEGVFGRDSRFRKRQEPGIGRT